MTEAIGHEFVEFAHRLADAAGEIVRPAARSRRVVHRKPDASPVTEIDRAVEVRLREMIAARYPGHGVIGEEFGDDRGDAEHVWVLDPVDGTKAFMAGLPVYCALVPVVANAGGVMTGWRGEPLTLDPAPGGRILASGSRALHEAAMARLAGEV